MKTKTLFMAITALAVGLAVSRADTVYSANIVGYVNQSLPVGYTMICCPVMATNAPTNSAEALLTCLAPGDMLYIWNGGGYDAYQYLDVGTWQQPDQSVGGPPYLAAGQGFFYSNGQGDTEVNTFTGTVQLTNTISLPVGYTMVGSTAPISGDAESTNFSLPLAPGDMLYLWNGGGYDAYQYLDVGTWQQPDQSVGGPPTLNVGQAWFYSNGQGDTEIWNQSVIVAP